MIRLDPESVEYLQRAIGVMTAWTEYCDGDQAILNAVLDLKSVEERDQLIRGFISLTGGLLTICRTEDNLSKRQVLQAIAAMINNAVAAEDQGE